MNKIYIKNLDITIKASELISIVGPNNSGKSSLINMFCGKHNIENIMLDNKNIKEYSLDYKRNNIACVLDDNIYNTNCVNEELEYNLKFLNYNEKEIKARVDYFKDYFSIDSIYYSAFYNLTIENRIFIKILSLLIIYPTIFCIDNLLTYLNKEKKIKLFNYIKEKNITLISVTSDMEELFFYDKILIVDKGKKVLFDKTEKVLLNEDVFKKLGLNMPFIYDINNMLKSYDLIKENHLAVKELVDILWK